MFLLFKICHYCHQHYNHLIIKPLCVANIADELSLNCHHLFSQTYQSAFAQAPWANLLDILGNVPRYTWQCCPCFFAATYAIRRDSKGDNII